VSFELFGLLLGLSLLGFFNFENCSERVNLGQFGSFFLVCVNLNLRTCLLQELEELLGMTAHLICLSGAHILLDLVPVLAVEFDGSEESFVLLGCPSS
jgi:hypothetical protein